MFVMDTSKIVDVLVEAKRLLNVGPNSWIKWKGWDGNGGYCALGATYTATAASKYPVSINQEANRYLDNAAVKVAEELGRPLKTADNDSARGDRQGRPDAPYFNNTAESIEEVNKMFCEAIEKAAEDQVREEEAHGETRDR